MLLESFPMIFGADSLTDAPNYSDMKPDQGALPGGVVATNMLSGLMFFALLFTLAGIVVSAGVWAVGSFSSNYNQSVNGKRAFMVCCGSAFFIGAAYQLVNWFYGTGTSIK